MKPREIAEAFAAEGGTHVEGYPVIDVPVFTTEKGTPYLQAPGVVVIGRTISSVAPLRGFLGGFDAKLGFPAYLDDPDEWAVVDAVEEGAQVTFQEDASYELQPLSDSARLVKVAGQLCYMSFGPIRTKNCGAVGYVRNLVASGHGSVLEHPNVSVLFYGVSRSFTHELVRHRAGCGFSQLSQRYVDGSRLRFVERPEYQEDPELHERFLTEIDRQAGEYEGLADALLKLQQEGAELLSGEAKRDRRKKVNQAARSVLGNHAEAPIIMTANLRAWRHVMNMRASEHAETEIRRVLFRAFLCLAMLDPIVFQDFQIAVFADGTQGVATPYPKV